MLSVSGPFSENTFGSNDMRLDDLAGLRPIFVVAQVLSWNALLIAVNAERDRVSVGVLCVLASANFGVACISGCARQSEWARALALRSESDPRRLSAILWLITFYSLSFCIFGFAYAWQLTQQSG